jgi:two-component system sensor histidine kinase DesK
MIEELDVLILRQCRELFDGRGSDSGIWDVLARQEIQQAASVTRDALREVRETVAGYRRPTLAGELAGAQEMLAAAGIGYHAEGQAPELSPHAEEALAWAVREGVTNVIRHSRAQRCVVRLSGTGDRVELEIIDDGAAGRADSPAASPRGSGLRALAERLAAAGGACEAHAQPAAGFRLSSWVPVASGRQA